ncbi:MAG TPA: NADP-specific glutamate dehydrogenase [Virgibacillus sp.]|nr:NADP-specific glutamate dehydrogenase [Virgibacillus sp.]
MITQEKQNSVTQYIDDLYQTVVSRDPHQTEFHQAIKLFFRSIVPVLEQHPIYIEKNILSQLVEPDRIITFRVPWMDDNGKVQVNRGYRVQFNNALGPYKGGLRFHPSVTTSVVKFLGFNQIFKNALTKQPLGGGKGGADFDPKGKSDQEVMRFCQSFMDELYKHIGPDTDIPAGDIGVGAREIGYMFGQYKKLTSAFHAGVLTGKGHTYGGSLGRTEATGYGTIYFAEEMLKENGLSFAGSRVVISGSGNVSIHAMEKAIELGATVVACSDSDGFIYDENGVDLQTIRELKDTGNERIHDYIDYHPSAQYNDTCTDIWSVPCDIAIPCATENELDEQGAALLINNGVKAVAEGANMPSTQEAIDTFLAANIPFGPAKAVNAGGVAVSALEMAQNSSRVSWTFEEIDEKLHEIMKDIYQNCTESAFKYGQPGNLIVGANIAGFKRVADTMIAHGVV